MADETGDESAGARTGQFLDHDGLEERIFVAHAAELGRKANSEHPGLGSLPLEFAGQLSGTLPAVDVRLTFLSHEAPQLLAVGLMFGGEEGIGGWTHGGTQAARESAA